jgi:small-conductance mechanosensitive channel
MSTLQQGPAIDFQQYVPSLIDTITTILTLSIVSFVVYQIERSVSDRAVVRSLQRRGSDERLIGFAVSMTVIVTTVFAIAIAATIAGFGIVLAAFATLGGAITLAVGFAAQDLIANFVASVFIIQNKPFAVGDWIE